MGRFVYLPIHEWLIFEVNVGKYTINCCALQGIFLRFPTIKDCCDSAPPDHFTHPLSWSVYGLWMSRCPQLKSEAIKSEDRIVSWNASHHYEKKTQVES